jgi:hypothetical protein
MRGIGANIPREVWAHIAAAIFLVVLVWTAFFGAYSGRASNKAPEPQQAAAAQKPPSTQEQLATQPPFLVQVVPATKTKEETEQDRQDRKAKADLDRSTIRLGWLTIIVAFLQFVAIGVQAFFLWGTLRATDIAARAAETQAGELKEATAEAAKSARAMESVAESMRKNVDRITESVEVNRQVAERQKLLGEKQLRAYISVTIGSAYYQDRALNIRFQGVGALVNSGNTPAQKLRYRARSGIFPLPLPPPEDFVLLLPSEWSVEDMTPPHSPPRTIGEAVLNFVDDHLISDIKQLRGLGLFVWGEVTYRDEFEAEHETKFCHMLTWIPTTPNETIRGFYIAGRNSMT